MGLQDSVENRYRQHAGREHRKTFAQFFTPTPVATVMAAFILENPNCRTILDPAAGLLGFSRALDDVLTLINSGQSHDLVNLIYTQVESTKAQLLQAPYLKAAATKASGTRAQAAIEKSVARAHAKAAARALKAQKEQAKQQAKLQATHARATPQSQVAGAGISMPSDAPSAALAQGPNAAFHATPHAAPHAAAQAAPHAAAHAAPQAAPHAAAQAAPSAAAPTLERTAVTALESAAPLVPVPADKTPSAEDAKAKECRFRSLFNKHTSPKAKSKSEVTTPSNPELKLSQQELKQLATGLVAYPEYLATQDTWFNPQSIILGAKHTTNPSINEHGVTLGHYSLSPRYHVVAAPDATNLDAANLGASASGAANSGATASGIAHSDALAAGAAADVALERPGQLSLELLAAPELAPAPRGPWLNTHALSLSGHSASRGYTADPFNPDYLSIIDALAPHEGEELRYRLRKIPSVTMVNYDLDPLIFESARHSCLQHPFGFVNNRLKCGDYLAAEINERFDGIICNPPYMSYRDFTQITGKESPALTDDLPRRTNTYTLFLLQSLKQLSSRGRCAYLIPYEFLNSSVGIKIKAELLKERSLCSVIIFKLPMFEGAITTTGLFLFDKAKQHQAVEFLTIKSLDELPALAVHLCPNLLGIMPQPQLQQDPLGSVSHAERTAHTPVPGSPVAAARATVLKTLPVLNQQALQNAVNKAPALIDTLSLTQLYQSGIIARPVKPLRISRVTGFSQAQLHECQQKLLSMLTPDNFGALSGMHVPYPMTLLGQAVAYADIQAERKWHVYYQGQEGSGQDEAKTPAPQATQPQVPAQRPAPQPMVAPALLERRRYLHLKDFIRVKRGIATGANEFFLFNHEEIKQHDLSPRYFVPALARASMAPYPILTLDDFVSLAARNQRVFLLSPPAEITDPKLQAYLQLGEEAGIHKRYLTSHRTPWYTMERRELAPLFISVFNRGSFNVIRNDARIYNLTAFHSLFVQDPELIDLIFAYLLTPLASELIMANRREYGRGLEKLEPMDIMDSSCIDFYGLSVSQLATIRDLMAQYEVIIDKARRGDEHLKTKALYQRALEHVLKKLSATFAAAS